MSLGNYFFNRLGLLTVGIFTSLFLIQCGSTKTISNDLNVIVIVSDSLRADHLGYAGYPRATSPFLDSLARESVIFENAVSSSSFTRESVATIFLGLLPSRSGSKGWRASPAEGIPTFAEFFKKNDYRTGFFVVTPVLWGKGFSRGFDEVDSLSSKWNQSQNSETLTDRALEFVDGLNGGKFAMYLHYLDPHGPYDPPDDIRDKFSSGANVKPVPLYGGIRNFCDRMIAEGFGPGEARFEDLVARYDAEILDVDRSLAKLFAGLKNHGVLENTLIVFTSDHGEEFLEHGYVEHAWTLYEESLHIPLLFWAPSLLDPSRINERVSLIDVLPSVLDLAEISEDGLQFDGTSLVKKTSDSFTISPHNKPVFSELLLDNRNVLRTIVKDNWKYIATVKWISPKRRSSLIRAGHDFLKVNKKFNFWRAPIREELYNLSDDPGETKNLANSEPAILDRFRTVMNTYLTSCKDNQGLGGAGSLDDLSAEELEKIRALGYIQ